MKNESKPTDLRSDLENETKSVDKAIYEQQQAAKSRKQPTDTDSQVDEASEESFPASDPPAYSAGTATPGHED